MELLAALPKLMFPQDQVNAIASQLLRVLMSFQHWYLPQVLRHDLPGGPQLWTVGVPVGGGGAGGAGGAGGGQWLPLCSDEAAYAHVTGRGVRGESDKGSPEIVRTVVSGTGAVAEHLPEEVGAAAGRFEGLAFDPGLPRMFVATKELMAQLRHCVASLRLELLLQRELREGSEDDPCPEQPPASAELGALLSSQVKLSFVRMGTDLARDDSGKNIVTLTSSDAAARCALAYGREMVRPVAADELRQMAVGAGDAFGYSLTIGGSRSPEGVPMWHSRRVSAAWLSSALDQASPPPSE